MPVQGLGGAGTHQAVGNGKELPSGKVGTLICPERLERCTILLLSPMGMGNYLVIASGKHPPLTDPEPSASAHRHGLGLQAVSPRKPPCKPPSKWPVMRGAESRLGGCWAGWRLSAPVMRKGWGMSSVAKPRRCDEL